MESMGSAPAAIEKHPKSTYDCSGVLSSSPHASAEKSGTGVMERPQATTEISTMGTTMAERHSMWCRKPDSTTPNSPSITCSDQASPIVTPVALEAMTRPMCSKPASASRKPRPTGMAPFTQAGMQRKRRQGRPSSAQPSMKKEEATHTVEAKRCLARTESSATASFRARL
jgi:hypothetical protein